MPKLTAEKRKELLRLAKMPDRRIDLSDIPEIKNIPSDAVIGKFYRPKKTSVTIRLDADVLAWLKATGEGYQTRINTYLRQLMRRNVQERSKSASPSSSPKGGKSAKLFRISLGASRVYTTFAIEFEAIREGHAELLKQTFLLGRGFGDAAQTDLTAFGGGKDNVGGL